METRSTYFTHLSQQVAEMLNRVLKEDGFSFFRKHAAVTFGNGGPASAYVLSLVRAVETAEDRGTFTAKLPGDNDRFVVYRSPTRMTASFLLEGKSLPASERLDALDKLTQYFFDNRTIDPILPENFAVSTSLRERMLSAKAELRQVDVQPFVSSQGQSLATMSDRFVFAFDYCALFHSGNVLREETKTKQRVIDLNDTNQRSN